MLTCNTDRQSLTYAFKLHITFQLSREQLDFERLGTAKQRSRLITVSLVIQARSWVFSSCVQGRHGVLDRDPLQKCHFAATKGLTAQTLAPDDAQGRGRSRQVKVRSSQVKLCQVESSQIKSTQGRSIQVEAGQIKSEQA